jgi:DNA-binding LacI/PurR family transcriptional regulator
MIRLKDVAAQAGVSLMTVSKVLRNAPDVSAATKAKIKRIAEEMGYVPDALARGLRTRRTMLFGLVIPAFNHPVLSQAAGAIANRAHEAGYDLLVAQSDDDSQREELSIRRLLSRRIDGLFLYPVYRLAPTASVYDELRKAAVPTVLLGPSAPFCNGLPSVHTDDASASYQVTQYLLKLGHQRIAFFAGPPAAPWAQERFDGYRRALREAEIPVDDRLIFTAGSSFEDGQRAAEQMLSESVPVTAVQAVSDAVAIGAVDAFWKKGIRIPEDLSLTGYGNHPTGELLRVPLTTVQTPKYALGQAAADLMLRLLRGESGESQRLATELVVRASTGPPNSPPGHGLR